MTKRSVNDRALHSFPWLRSAAEAMLLAYYADGKDAADHFNVAINALQEATAQLGFVLSPATPVDTAPGANDAA